MEYIVVPSRSMGSESLCEKIEKQVNHFISKGFKPIGSLQVVYSERDYSYTAFQAMIKED